jgi:predicted MPP superfamily phosphohydrolase
MTEFRLTQISDTHLARRLTKLTANFDAIRDHIDATRPDLVVNSGDVAFDGPTAPDDLAFAKSLHEALPVPCRYLPGNHDIGDNPTELGPVPPQVVNEKDRQSFIAAFGHDRWDSQRGRAVRLARLRTRHRQWQAGRAVPAQARVPQHARRPGTGRERDPLCAAAAAAAAGRNASNRRPPADR